VDSELKKIAEFYNSYQSDIYKDPSKTNTAKKQMEDIVSVLGATLVELSKGNEDMPVGMLLTSLVSKDLVPNNKFIEVQEDLKELKNIGNMLNLSPQLMAVLNAVTGD